MRYWKGFSYLIVLMFALTLVGCGSGSDGASSGENGGKSTSEKADDGILTIANGADMVTFDTQDHLTTSTWSVHLNMFDYLVQRDENGEYQPSAAESWENISDNEWEFVLRDDITFHNGDPVTANDVKFTLERVAKDEALLQHYLFQQIKEVNVVDDHTFRIVTDGPAPALFNTLALMGSEILPSKYIEENGMDHFLQNPIGSGPYKFVEWKKDDRITLERNDEYWAYEPEWEQVVFRVVPEDSTRTGELLTGGVDVALNVSPNDWERVDGNNGTYISQNETTRVMQLVLRTAGDHATVDPRVREAIELAIDKQGIVDGIINGAGTITRSAVTPTAFGGHEGLYGDDIYDPERAKELLKEAGYEDGLELTFSIPNGRYLKDKEVGETIQSMLAEVGITANLDVLEWSKWIEKYNGKTFPEIYMSGYANEILDAKDPLGMMESEKTKGETDYNNPEYDELLEKAIRNMNPEERVEQYERAQEIIAEERPRIFLYAVKMVSGVSDHLDFNPEGELIYADRVTPKN
ncbi:oligopeptide ABC transporter substrate-binding protein [Bacillus freudenreichii]|nr:oligopeptide ABC transporter substrate-binding protein [Bacillus freudenreichii]